MTGLSKRSYSRLTWAASWEEIWEAGPYFERLSQLLEDATSYAIIAGWQIDSRLPMPWPERPGRTRAAATERLRSKLIRICNEKPGFQVFILMWDHAYLYVLEREPWQGRVWEGIHARVHFLFDNRHPFGASHHEKVFIADGAIALSGGVDLCDERWDSPSHLFNDPRRSLDRRHETHGPYHDLAVEVTGPACAEIQEHLARRWRALSTIPFPSPRAQAPEAPPPGSHRVYVSRTVSPVDGLPITREIEFLFRDLIGSARRRLVMEGQYYWSRHVNDLLVAKMRREAARRVRDEPPFEIILVVAHLAKARSLTRKMAAHELRLLALLQETARETDTRLVLGNPYVQPETDRDEAKPVYVHSKVIVVDDRFLCIGSANLATRAFRTDTEINLTLEADREEERAHVRRVANQILRHWGLAEATHGPRLRPIRPAVEIAQLDLVSRVVPWGMFFDPDVPWFHLVRRGLKGWRGRVAVLLAWLPCLGLTLAVLPASLPSRELRWAVLGAVLLSSAWLARIPFVATAVALALACGREAAGPLIFVAAAACGATGYAAARAYPAAFARKLRTASGREKLGRRSFAALAGLVLSPRYAFRDKVWLQGICSMPLPWFAVSGLLLLPAATTAVAIAVSSALRWAIERALGP